MLCSQDRIPIGRVEDTFGPVMCPLYTLRWAGQGDMPPSLVQGAPIFTTQKLAEYLLPEQLYTNVSPAAPAVVLRPTYPLSSKAMSVPELANTSISGKYTVPDPPQTAVFVLTLHLYCLGTQTWNWPRVEPLSIETICVLEFACVCCTGLLVGKCLCILSTWTND